MSKPFRAVILAHRVNLAALSAFAAWLNARTQGRNPAAQRAAWVVRFDRRTDELAAKINAGKAGRLAREGTHHGKQRKTAQLENGQGQ